MKFPSIKNLAESTGRTIKRFPFELLFALAGTIAATIKIELADINRAGENWCLRIMIVGNLGLLLTLSATLFSESRQIKPGKKLLLSSIAATIAVSLLFLINPGIREADYVRFFLLSLGLHLLVAFAAFTNNYHIQGFWQFNKTLFLRFLTAVLYSIVLYAGISAAIGAMNYLFNFKFEWDTFSILFTWIIGIFSTAFFLAGVPGNFTELDEDESYPKGLKIFTQYVLIPLASVYVLILLAYEIKILVQWNLPKGSVSYLILSYAVFGILSLLLVYPIRNHEENKWLKTYSRSFYFLLIPLLGLLFVAASERLLSYGVTEFRYFLLALACWLLFITVYFLLFKTQNIKIIPISLCIITLLSVYGPQSAFSVSMYSQRSILIGILKRNNAFKGGKLVPAKNIGKIDGGRASDILYYLITHHDLTSLQPYFSKNLTAVSDSLGEQKGGWANNFEVENYELREKKVEWARNYLGLSKFSGYYGRRYNIDTANDDNTTLYNFHTQGDVINTKGYDYFINIKSYRDTSSETQDGIKFGLRRSASRDYFIDLNNEHASFDMRAFAKALIAKKTHFENVSTAYDNEMDRKVNSFAAPEDSLKLSAETKHYTITLAVSLISITQAKKADIDITAVDANYLIKVK